MKYVIYLGELGLVLGDDFFRQYTIIPIESIRLGFAQSHNAHTSCTSSKYKYI